MISFRHKIGGARTLKICKIPAQRHKYISELQILKKFTFMECSLWVLLEMAMPPFQKGEAKERNFDASVEGPFQKERPL
jgi:hypothetical protein